MENRTRQDQAGPGWDGEISINIKIARRGGRTGLNWLTDWLVKTSQCLQTNGALLSFIYAPIIMNNKTELRVYCYDISRKLDTSPLIYHLVTT